MKAFPADCDKIVGRRQGLRGQHMQCKIVSVVVFVATTLAAHSADARQSAAKPDSPTAAERWPPRRFRPVM